MGFFDRKKVKKTAPNTPLNHPPRQPPPPQHSSTQTPQYWHQPQQQQHHHHQHQHHDYRQPQSFQPAGYLPAPPGWTPQPQSPPPPYGYQQPIVVNQHYYLSPPNSPPNTHAGSTGMNCNLANLGNGTLGKFTGSMVHLAKEVVPPNMGVPFIDDGLPACTHIINQTAACIDQISSRFNDVMTLIDRERFKGNEGDLFTYQPYPSQTQELVPVEKPKGALGSPKKKGRDAPKGQTTAVAASVVSGSYFAKVELYANARLPMNLPPLRLYIPTWPLLCLAAQYAERVYDSARGAERDAHVSADWRTGTKAMVIKSVPMDHMNTIVFAIRGTATFMDWAVNLNSAPTAPTGFLDDMGNSCHAGFLTVARKMVKPVAARLRQLLQEDPSRASYSLLITGHSAGGAVAALLYSHMLAVTKQAESELNILTGCFKRVHCVTFGTPPVSLLPLQRPDRPELRKSLFLSFVNEGDPVCRADKAYVKSLLELFATPAPSPPKPKQSSSSSLLLHGAPNTKPSKSPRKEKSKASLATKASKVSMKSTSSGSKSTRSGPVWKLPPCTLSSAGRIVVLRTGDPTAKVKDRKTVEERLNEGVVAQTVSDDMLRGVIWGDPVCHVMKLYSGRIEILAVGAVTGKNGR